MSRPLTGIPADEARSYSSIELTTTTLRSTLKLEYLDAFDALTFFNDALGDITIPSRGKTIKMIEAVEDCPQEGLTRWDSTASRLEIVLADRTFKMLLENHVRARSTVAHEAGHAFLHTEQIIRLAGMNLKSQVAFHRDRVPHKAFRDTEWQANAFGSSLLMPAAGVDELSKRTKTFGPSTLANNYGVSLESALYRLQTYRRSLGFAS